MRNDEIAQVFGDELEEAAAEAPDQELGQ